MIERTHAVVMGGGLAGLLCALVLAKYFEKVTLLDHDTLPNSLEHRTSIPQANHAHGLLPYGKELLEELIPGFTQEILKEGGLVIQLPKDVKATITNPVRDSKHQAETTMQSRDLLEGIIRRHVRALPNVIIKDQFQITSLKNDSKSIKAVIGHNRKDSNEEEIEADVFVDALGRFSQTSSWLTKIGYKAVEQSIVDSFTGYVTRWYKKPQDKNIDWKLLSIPAAPNGTRRGIITSVENDQWIASVSGFSKDYPATTETGFLEFAKTLPDPQFYKVIKDAVPVSPIYSYRNTQNIVRKYHEFQDIPDNMIFVGDAVCALNPAYGQGITLCAISATVLDTCLKNKDISQFQKKLWKELWLPWFMTINKDFQYKMTQGKRPNILDRLLFKYLQAVIKLQTRFIKIEDIHLSSPAIALFNPIIIFKVLTSLSRG